MAKVKGSTSGKTAAKVSGAKTAKAARGATKSKATEQKRTVKKADKFAGSSSAKAARPAAQLPRSGWKNTEAFKSAARTARASTGAVGLPDRPVIRPLYGLAVPVPLDINLKDKDLNAAVKTMLRDRKMNVAEVSEFIRIAGDNGGLSKTEKKDLKRLIDKGSEFFEMPALQKLQKFVSGEVPVDRPTIRPMYGLPIPVPLPVAMKDVELKDALTPILRDRVINLAEVRALIRIAKDNGGIDAQERADLVRLHKEGKTFFAPDALAALAKELGIIDGPVVRPLYGLPVPVPFDVRLKDKPLDTAMTGIMRDRKISLTEVEQLITIANDGRGLSRTERGDLELLLSKAGRFFDGDAKLRLEEYLGHGPQIRPLYGLPFALPSEPSDGIVRPMAMSASVATPRPKVELSHVEALIATANGNGGLSRHEESTLKALLAGGATFSAPARAKLEGFLGVQ